jgi:hypothetical protein
MTNPSKLAEILDNLISQLIVLGIDESPDKLKVGAEQAILALVDEAIGDDELYGDIKTTVYEVPKGVKRIEVPRAEFVIRDNLRAEIRAKLGITGEGDNE